MQQTVQKKAKTKIVVLIWLMACYTVCLSQNAYKKDSLFKIASKHQKDSIAVNAYYKLAWIYLNHNLDSSEFYIRKGGELSNKLNFLTGKIKYCFCISQIYNERRKFDLSIIANKEAITLAENYWKKDWALKAAYCNLAWSYICENRGSDAMEAYQKSIVLCEKTKDSLLLAKNLVDMVERHTILGWPLKAAYQNSIRALTIFKTLNEKDEIPNALFRLGTVLLEAKKYDSAMLLTKQSLQLAKEYNTDVYFEGDALTIIVKVLIKQGRINELQPYVEKLFVVEKKTAGGSESVHANYFEAVYFLYRQKFDSAEKYASKTVRLCHLYNEEGETLYNAYQLLAEIALVQRNLKAYHRYNLDYESVKSAMDSLTLYKNGQDIEARYSLEKKEAQIQNLNQEKEIQQLQLKQSQTVIFFLVALVVLFVFVTFLLFRNSQQKRKIQQHRIAELQKDKQLIITEAIVKGQEEERSRLAKDLHDGLGGILWGVKSSLSTMKGNMILTGDNGQSFERSLDMLDNSILELRRVAHNLMPEALVKFGLTSSLKDFCDFVNSSKVVEVIFQSVGNERRLDLSIEVVMYRVANELVNNALRYASAKEIILQLNYDDNTLTMTVEDDGVGFDKSLLDKTTGSGWSNIKSRIAYLKGSLDVQTNPGKGTAVNVTIPI